MCCTLVLMYSLSPLRLAGLEARQWLTGTEEEKQRQRLQYQLQDLQREVNELKGEKEKGKGKGSDVCGCVLLCAAAYWFFRDDKPKKDDGEKWKE